MTGKIVHKVMKGACYYKEDARKKVARLQRESPNAAFKFEGKRGDGYTIYQVWYDR